MKILIDMDGVLADFELGFLQKYRRRYPDQPFIPLQNRKLFHLSQEYPLEQKPYVDTIIQGKGFFRSLPPIPGSIEALKKILEKDVEVFICTSPLSKYHNCVLEKYEWIERYFGMDLTTRIIMTRDKTLVSGDILIDDRPLIKGVNQQPSWEHILFAQPYNQHIINKRRITWKNWEKHLTLHET